MPSQFETLEAKHQDERVSLATDILKNNRLGIKTSKDGETYESVTFRLAKNMGNPDSFKDLRIAVMTLLEHNKAIDAAETYPERAAPGNYWIPNGGQLRFTYSSDAITLSNTRPPADRRSSKAFMAFSDELLKDVLPKQKGVAL